VVRRGRRRRPGRTRRRARRSGAHLTRRRARWPRGVRRLPSCSRAPVPGRLRRCVGGTRMGGEATGFARPRRRPARRGGQHSSCCINRSSTVPRRGRCGTTSPGPPPYRRVRTRPRDRPEWAGGRAHLVLRVGSVAG
jgi:hypothetical protein